MSAPDGTFEPLRGLRVLELGDGVAGAAAGSVLASYGADVTTVRESSTRHGTAPRAIDDDGAERSLLSILLDVGKTVVADTGNTAFGSFDVVICDRVDRTRGPHPDGHR